MEITLNGQYTLIAAALVMLLGHWLVFRIRLLSSFNIPEPVAGGLVAAFFITLLNATTGLTFRLDTDLQTTCMLMFFASIGLSADFTRLKAGGRPLAVLLALVSAFIVVQNIIGVSLAALLGLKPLIGLMAGSITLTGGHGTAGAWGPVLETRYGITGATTLGIATATFGLVFGGLVGGPVARYLIRRQGRAPVPDAQARTSIETLSGTPRHNPGTESEEANRLAFELVDQPRLITTYSAIETLAMFAACLVCADLLSRWTHGTAIELPTFIWALASGVVIRNTLTHLFRFRMFDRAIDVFGNTALSLFLAIALIGLRLWELADLAGPVAVILATQVVAIMLYATFITYRFMGSDYDAAVVAAGHCGFGLGATPTAIANMQAVTDRFGPSYKAYLIVPLVGAFFVDLVNAAILQAFTQIPWLQ
ncbi:MAG: sodium/glutamate symporter [Castellaniella sp.]|uniref:sodium/glutamate symporter n=1 Tax=Castellaniella sp. TaxID=1955812 RepID=UPI002A36F9B1|nr:sodium/glutamate symporter [Castellaniella sp.]MDY0309332.1 sodium/glutamate symporter [Castellaniella sp.]